MCELIDLHSRNKNMITYVVLVAPKLICDLHPDVAKAADSCRTLHIMMGCSLDP